MPRWLHIILWCPASSLAERGNKGMRCTDFYVLPCSVLVVAGEGTACFLAVSNALAEPCLSTKLQWDQDQSERSGLSCPLPSHHSTSPTLTQKTNQQSSLAMHAFNKNTTQRHNNTLMHKMKAFGVNNMNETTLTLPMTLNTQSYIYWMFWT